MSQILTNALATYKAQKEAAEEPIVLDQIVFAYVPGIDPEADIDPETTLPDESFIVYRYDIPEENKGFINPNAVVYSCLLGSDIGTWTYNSIYLINSELNLAASIITTLDQTKVASDPTNGIEGDTLVRNIVTTYSNAQELTGINVAAETWQLDFTSRLSAIDERIRQVNLSEYGQAAFFEDGWKVTHTAAATSATVSPGVGYVGGLKSVLESTQTLNLTGITLPKTVYLVSTFQGQANSAWETLSELRVLDALDDTFTEDGNIYYSAPLALLSSSADAEDLRTMNKETDFVHKSSAATNADIDAESTAIKHINLPQLWRAFTKKITELKEEENPFSQYLQNKNLATYEQAKAGEDNSVWMSALRSMEQLTSRISGSLTGTRTDYTASEKALSEVNTKAENAQSTANNAYSADNLPPYTLVQTIDLSAQDSSLFYPLVLNGIDQSVGRGWFLELASQGGSATAEYNATTLVGYLRGGGYSDYEELFDVNVSIYDPTEITIHSAWQGTESFPGVVIYIRGGTQYYFRANDIAEVHTETDFNYGNSIFPAGIPEINTGVLTKASLIAEFTHTGNYNNIGVFNTENPPTPEQVGAVPITRTINSKALDKNIILDSDDIGSLKGKTVKANFGNQDSWIKIATAYLPSSSSTIKIAISGGGGFNLEANYQSSMHQIIARAGNSQGHVNCRLYTQDMAGSPFSQVGAVHTGDSQFDIYAKSRSNYSHSVIVEYSSTNTFTTKNEVTEDEPAGMIKGDVVEDYNSANPQPIESIIASLYKNDTEEFEENITLSESLNNFSAVIVTALIRSDTSTYTSSVTIPTDMWLVDTENTLEPLKRWAIGDGNDKDRWLYISMWRHSNTQIYCSISNNTLSGARVLSIHGMRDLSTVTRSSKSWKLKNE